MVTFDLCFHTARLLCFSGSQLFGCPISLSFLGSTSSISPSTLLHRMQTDNTNAFPDRSLAQVKVPKYLERTIYASIMLTMI